MAEVWIIAGISVGFVALALFSIGFDELPAGANRSLGYAVTAGYFVVSAAVLTWAIRRRGDRERRVYLIPLLVIVATLITNVVIDRIL